LSEIVICNGLEDTVGTGVTVRQIICNEAHILVGQLIHKLKSQSI